MSLANNRKARHDYDIIEEYEAGIVLEGTEVKSVKSGHANMNDAHIRIMNGEAFLINCHVSPYSQGNINNHDPMRTRKLLLKRRQLEYLAGKVKEQGLTLIPLKLYIKNRYVKLSFGLGKGKKLYDKRQSIKERESKIEVARALSNRNKEA